ncbi:MAG: spermidine/putrescine ABC transporter substrate-binding protein [Tissierellia bacterium]|nr:spermidine/putrescine ABC transporter substrate-binding protein [Tissierellia bacterium]
MKKLKIFSILFAICSILTLLAGCQSGDSATLYVYNWGDYMDPEVLKMFEEEENCKISYQEFATNEDLYVKIKNTRDPIDVIFPSDYMMERMIQENLVLELDYSHIPNMEKANDKFKHLDFDPENKYSAPYFWGTVGIVYNTEKVDGEITSWADLWNPKYEGQIVLYNSQRDVLMIALKKLGYSMNTRSEAELEEAKEELMKQKPLVYAYLGDEIKDVLAGEDADIGVVYSGDAGIVMSTNDKFRYVLPKEGTNLWFDVAAVPKTTQNKELAEKFINFLLRPDIAAMNAEYLQYATPVDEAKDLLSEELIGNPALYPDETLLENTEVFHDPKEVLKLYDRIWTEFTSGL